MASGDLKVFGELGDILPKDDVHGISVHLPTWEATLGWANRNPKLIKQMKNGYPRFFFHRLVVELGEQVQQMIDESGLSAFPQTHNNGYSVMLFPIQRSAEDLMEYLERQGRDLVPPPSFECYLLSAEPRTDEVITQQRTRRANWQSFELAAVIFPASEHLLSLAKQFWMHTGLGISSRYAETCLKALPYLSISTVKQPCTKDGQTSNAAPLNAADGKAVAAAHSANGKVQLVREGDVQLSELRSQLHLESDGHCKTILRNRLATLNSSETLSVPDTDVFLYCTGMSAITAIAGVLKSISVCAAAPMVAFGFLYVDTFKVIERVHEMSTTLHGHASASEINDLSEWLSSGKTIAGLVLEFPGNPLLKSPDLSRLRALADTYKFPIVVDDTLGTPVNVNVMRHADIIATSLSKMFSGACNTMGGALILNPSLSFHGQLHEELQREYIDTYFPLDAEIMVKNSADFAERAIRASKNAESIAYQLRRNPAVSEVFYPRGSDTQSLYDRYKREDAGYGYLLSCNFIAPEAATAFFDALDTAKGPSLGTNFTLCCPYTLYGHWGELEWAQSYGVSEHLVRMSVGLEDLSELTAIIEEALRAAEKATWNVESR